MEDRTADLLKARKSNRPDEHNNNSSNSSSASSPPKLEGLQAEVADITMLLNQIRENTDRIAKGSAQKKFDDLQSVIDETNPMLMLVRQKVSELSKGMSKDEIRKTQFKRLNEQFKEIGQRYKDTQEVYRTSLVESVMSEARVVAPKITREEVEALIATGKDSTFFTEKLLGEAHARAKEEYRFISGWYQDLKKLEVSMNELLNLFIDVSVQVEASAPVLDNIEQNLDEANVQSEEAVKHLNKAAGHARAKGRRRACCCCVAGAAGGSRNTPTYYPHISMITSFVYGCSSPLLSSLLHHLYRSYSPISFHSLLLSTLLFIQLAVSLSSSSSSL